LGWSAYYNYFRSTDSYNKFGKVMGGAGFQGGGQLPLNPRENGVPMRKKFFEAP